MAEQLTHALPATNLADILERVLDKGIVVAGDIQIKLAEVDLLTIKIRLMIASVDKAKEMGINWWESDSYLSTNARQIEAEKEAAKLSRKIEKLEAQILKSRSKESAKK